MVKKISWVDTNWYVWTRTAKYNYFFDGLSNPDLIETLQLGTIHLRRRQIFKIFDPYPPTIAQWYFCMKLRKFYFGFFLSCCNLLNIKHYLKGLKQHLIICCWYKTQHMSLKLGWHQYIFQLQDLLKLPTFTQCPSVCTEAKIKLTLFYTCASLGKLM